MRSLHQQNLQTLKCQNDKTNILSYSSREFDKCFDIFCAENLILSIYEYIMSEKKNISCKSRLPFCSKKNEKNIRSLHKIMEETFCTKIKILLARCLFSKTKYEDQGISLVWPYGNFSVLNQKSL